MYAYILYMWAQEFGIMKEAPVERRYNSGNIIF